MPDSQICVFLRNPKLLRKLTLILLAATAVTVRQYIKEIFSRSIFTAALTHSESAY